MQNNTYNRVQVWCVACYPGSSSLTKFFSRNFLACLQHIASLFLLLRVDISGLHNMKNFSHKHKLHLLVTFEYKDLACFTSLHLMSYEMFSSFKLHMYLLSSVECLYRSLRNEHTLFLYLNLKVVSRSPMYVSFVVVVVTSAW